MKTIPSLLLALTAATLLAGCGSSDSDAKTAAGAPAAAQSAVSPEKAVQNLLEGVIKASQKHDFNAFSKLVSPSEGNDKDDLKLFFEEMGADIFAEMTVSDLGPVVVKGDTATIELSDDLALEFKKTGDGWKILLP